MPTKRMLIDASHPEETRVVVLNGNRLEEFDVEVESRRQLKGNIYLAKVTRVEPSLQAAFVDYGGTRHGFLAFSEIHPDYYQIPIADREQLIAEEQAAARSSGDGDGDGDEDKDGAENGGAPVETVGGDDEDEVEARHPVPAHRRYKIQEVIKHRQILLVQVVKEERGNKGAALTTYMSLAGRYCVLMPNTARGGGISRKISHSSDRKRLKTVLADLGIPEGMAVIVRTAGAERSKAEIKRDYEYLLRAWDNVRTLTLESTAPTLVYEEGDLIRRSIRDLYSRDIDEIIVDGEAGYRHAKNFMKLLIPSHAKKVQPHKDTAVPLLQRYQIENQLDAIHSPDVQLKSGGYIVINPTEALVAIDVNSGRATRERNIEETALRTNLEAAEEVARQVRLRDLAGLIVIDFIDMEVTRNQIKVERQLKEAMRTDRARIQIGRISPFGLLEFSRQRLRPSLIETSSEPCPYCAGTGVRRSTESTALAVLRAIEEEGLKRRAEEVTVYVPTEVALYILNNKRETLAEIEQKYEFSVRLENDDSLIPPASRIERGKTKPQAKSGKAQAANDDVAATGEDEPEEGDKRRRRRRSRRRKRGDDRDNTAESVEAQDGEEAAEAAEESEVAAEAAGDEERGEDGEDGATRRRRRGRRGGRRRRKSADGEAAAEAAESAAESAPGEDAEGEAVAESESADGAETPADAAETDEGAAPPKRRRRRSRKTAPADEAVESAETNAAEGTDDNTVDASEEAAEEEKPARKPRRRSRAKSKPAAAEDEATAEPESVADAEVSDEAASEDAEAEPAAAEADEMPLPLPEPAPMAAAEATPEPVLTDPAATEPPEHSRTEVITVGPAEDADDKKPARKGWWNRITS